MVKQNVELLKNTALEVAEFRKVSFEQFSKSMKKEFGNKFSVDELIESYENIRLPQRKTNGSAGYDFAIPFNLTIAPSGITKKIPTGIRCNIKENWVLKCYPRSGLGTKYRLCLANTVGIIDSDYFYSDNEGHIIVVLCNDNSDENIVILKQGDCFMQGIFSKYGITVDDNATGIRNGGFGSTNLIKYKTN